METFLEGAESVTLPCTLIILLPAVALLAATRANRLVAASGYLVGTAVLMWARAARVWNVESTGAIIILIAAVIVAAWATVAAAGAAALRRIVIAGFAAGAIAGWLWEPCVGTAFGDILNRAESERLSTLAMMHVYVAGALLPAMLIAVLPHAAPRIRPAIEHRLVHRIGLAFGIAYAGTVAFGRHDDIVGELFRISSR